MLEKSRTTKPTFTRLCTESGKSISRQTSQKLLHRPIKGKRSLSTSEQFSRILTQNFNVREKKKSALLKLILKIHYALFNSAKLRREL